MASSYIVIPGTDVKLYNGDIVRISNRPRIKWIVHTGWYIYEGVQSFGWYFVSVSSNEILPATMVDLTLCTLATQKVVGSECYDGKKVDYTRPFTESDAIILNSTFITVETITQRDNLDQKKLINGRMVRVNDVDGLPKYYSWNAENNRWDEVANAGESIPEVIGTPTNPVILSNLTGGLYRVIGTYLVTPTSDTSADTNIDHLVFVNSDRTYVKVITESTITDYAIADDHESLIDKYATHLYVDTQLSALERQISEIISELAASGISYRPPESGVTSDSHTVQEAIDALNDAISTNSEVFYGTTEYWNKQPQFIPRKGCIYIYSDHTTDTSGTYLPGMKIGDGKSYLIDMPFMDKLYAEHIANDIIHVSPEDRIFWNNKVTCLLDPLSENTLVITKD